MILKRYGTQLHSVAPNFDARAMNEIGFQKSAEHSMAAAEFASAYEKIGAHELTAAAEGDVQVVAEKEVLDALHAQLQKIRSELKEGHVLLVESEPGRDYPKLREKMSTIVIDGQNRLHFERTIDPPLRIGVYAPRKR